MSTITLPNIRVSSDLTVSLKLKDDGVAIDWSTLSNVKVSIYSDAQRALAGRCSVSIDEDAPTLLVCTYAANKPQYVGVNRVVVCAKYMGETKTYDKPAFNFVRWTDDQAGQTITIDDPDIDVEISVEDISSSILQEAVDAAFTAADRANDAAAAAEHMVDIHTGPEGKSAYEVAVEEGYTGTEEEWLASLKGPVGETPDISIGTVTTVEPGTPAAASMTGTPEAPVLNLSIPKGLVGATPNFTVGTVTTGEPGSSVIVTITGTPEAPVLNLTIPQGVQGNTGASVEYPYELVNNLTTDDATKGLSAAQGVVLDGKVTQLEAEVNENNTILSPVDLSVLTESKGIINSSGKWQNTSGYCVFVPLTPGKPYKVVARDTGSDIGVLAEAGMGANGANVVFATGYSSRIVIQPSSTLEFVAPVDAVSLYVRTKNSQGTNVTPTVYAPSGTVKQKVESLDEDVTELQDISKALTGYTLQGQGDTWSSTQLSLAPGVKYTVFLADKNVSMTGVTSTNARFAIDAYNSSNVRIERLVVINVGTALDDSYLITIPDECSYLLIGCRCENGVDFGFAISVGDSRGSKNSDDLLVGTFNSSFNETDTEATRVAYSSLIDGKNTIETFLLFSDPHLTPQSRYETMTEIIRNKYISTLQRYYNSLPEDMCICLGDWLNFKHTNPEACGWLGYCDAYMRKLFKNYFPLLGNHDMNPYNPDSGSTSWLNSLYYKTCENLMFRQNGGTYYSFDGRNTKFYALNTGISPIKTMTNSTLARLVNNRWEQVAWLGEKLLADDAEHSVILMHIYANAGNEDDWFSTEEGMGAKGIHDLAKNVKALVTAYNKRQSITLNDETYDFSSCDGQVLMMMCGHAHFDYVDTTGYVPVVCTTNLEGGVLDDDTITYQLIPTFDNCIIDYDNDRFYAVRVGAGVSRIVNYTPKSVNTGNTLSLTTELTGTVTWASRDGDIATVSSGTVSGVASGTVGIIATDENGKQEYWTVVVS